MLASLFAGDFFSFEPQIILEFFCAHPHYLVVDSDAKELVQDVNAALCDILVEHGNLTAVDAKALFATWTDEKKIVRDVWE